MPSYRFCRPDDIPLLVRAVESCVRADDPDEPPWSEEGLRRGMREIDLWPSNSMVALDSAADPVAVMIGTKRPEAVAVHRLGVRADHRRQGHGVHLLTSLSQKLAVLGPERLVAEVPEDRPAALACFAAAGYRRQATLVDWRRPAEAAEADEPVPEGLVEEVSVADLDATGVLADAPATAWCRTRRTLLQSADRLDAAAIASPDRLEAWVVFDLSAPPPVVVLTAGAADPARAPLLLGVLFRWLAGRAPVRPLLVPRLAADEIAPDVLAVHGYVPGRTWARLAATARPL